MSSDKTQPVNLLDKSRSPARIILFLAWPTIFEQIMLTMVQYVDTAMVGSLGADATASVALNASCTWLLSGIMTAAGIGFSVQVSRHIGGGNLDKARQVVRQALTATAILGVCVTLLMQLIARRLPYWLGADPAIIPDAGLYLSTVTSVFALHLCSVVCSGIMRGAGDTRTPMLFNLFTNLLNIAGNALLIFPTRPVTLGGRSFTMWGAGLGVWGAAISTAFAAALTGCIMLGCIFFKPSPVRISIRGDYRPNRKIMRDAWFLALPAALERVTISVGQILVTYIVTSVGTAALAAHHLAVTAESLSYLPAYGLGVAATTLVAQSLGAGEKEMAYQYGRLCALFGVAFMAVGGVILFVFSTPLIQIFTRDAGVILQGAQLLRIVSVIEPFFAVSIVLFGVFRGAGDSKWPFYISIMGMWVVRLTLSWLFAKVLDWGLSGIWVAIDIDLFLRAALCYARFCSRGWMNVWDKREAKLAETV